ncbi:MAG: YitT family protein [Clostridia bacterium]
MDKKKERILKGVISAVGILLGSLIMAMSMHIFTIPAKFAPGGVGGIASLVQIVFGFQAGYTMLILNVPLVILAFVYLSKPFAAKTMVSILLISLFLQLFNHFNVFEYFDPNALILSSVAGGILYGAGIAVLIRVGACSGGTDIISLLIQKKHNSLSVSWLIFYMNLVIITVGGILYLTVSKIDLTSVLSIILYSLLEIFLTSKSMEVCLNGVNSAVKFEVVTNKAEEIRSRVMTDLHRSVTILDSRGGYSDAPNNILLCVVKKYQITLFRKVLKEVDPQAFAFAFDTREVLGNGFEVDLANINKNETFFYKKSKRAVENIEKKATETRQNIEQKALQRKQKSATKTQKKQACECENQSERITKEIDVNVKSCENSNESQSNASQKSAKNEMEVGKNQSLSDEKIDKKAVDKMSEKNKKDVEKDVEKINDKVSKIDKKIVDTFVEKQDKITVEKQEKVAVERSQITCDSDIK